MRQCCIQQLTVRTDWVSSSRHIKNIVSNWRCHFHLGNSTFGVTRLRMTPEHSARTLSIYIGMFSQLMGELSIWSTYCQSVELEVYKRLNLKHILIIIHLKQPDLWNFALETKKIGIVTSKTLFKVVIIYLHEVLNQLHWALRLICKCINSQRIAFEIIFFIVLVEIIARKES